MAGSAMPRCAKRTILTQECLRIILSCSQKLEWNQIAAHISMFTRRMQLSGYSKRFRYEIVKSAIHASNKLKEDEREGKRPIYRPKTYKTAERKKENEIKRKNWY